MEAALAEKATKEIKSRLLKQDKARKAREKELLQIQAVQLAAERAEQARVNANIQAHALAQGGPPALSLPNRPSPAMGARPPGPAGYQGRPGMARPPQAGAQQGNFRPPNGPGRPPNNNNNVRPPAVTAATTVPIPIIVAPIPAAALKNLTAPTNPLLDSPALVLHEGTIILNPSVFSHLSKEQLDHLRSL